jgi:hypothetical protein
MYSPAPSLDGINFRPVGTITVAINQGLWIGVAATSHNTAASATAVFDDVAIAQPSRRQRLLPFSRLTSRQGPR